MLDFRPVLHLTGLFVCGFGGLMIFPMLVDLANGDSDWRVFATAGGVCLVLGANMALAFRTTLSGVTLKQTFLLTSLTWVLLVSFAALPLAYSRMGLSMTDAFFEAMSGLTTTGSTVIVGLDTAPRGVLLWRGLLQWIGGVGIIVTAISVLPMLRVGGMQLFRTESSEKGEKVLPRTLKVGLGITLVYVAMTGVCALLYMAAGMHAFDAAVHAFTTVATGGFGNYDASFAEFDDHAMELIATFFMFAAGIPFLLYVQAIRGFPMELLRDQQVRWYAGIAAGVIGVMTLYRWTSADPELWEAFRHSAFNVISVMTGTGYASTDYGTWGGFATTLFLGIMFIGGCTGSTTCSVKVFRYMVLWESIRVQFLRMVHPNGIFHARFNRRALPDEVVESVRGFLFVFIGGFVFFALMLGLIGLDFVTSVSGAATALANVGPGLGATIGPAGNFAGLPDAAKWTLSAAMLLGRLELFTVLILFVPSFWRD